MKTAFWRRKWKRSDSSDSDSVALMALLPTPIFDFHWVISTLVDPLTSSTLTSSLVKTSHYCPHTNSAGWFPHNSWGNLSTEFSLWGGGGGGWMGVCKSADPLWFINQIRPSIIALNPKSRQKSPKSKIWVQKYMNPQSTVIAGSRNPLKSHFDSEIQAKIFSKSADPFAYSSLSSLVVISLIIIFS